MASSGSAEEAMAGVPIMMGSGSNGSESKSDVKEMEEKLPGSGEGGGARRKRKKSRWGEAPRDSSQVKTSRPKKKSRWGAPEDRISVPANAAYATKGLTPEQIETFLFRMQLEQINQKLLNPAQYVAAEDLGASPPPMYDSNGQRVNTREKRFKDKLMADRQKLLEKAIATNPALKALAPGFQPAKKVERINIPVEKYPDYNFIGLIIGPRGNTQKRMEKETLCKISIRGKGSSKKGRPQPDEDQPLHVHIIAPDDEKMEKAKAMIKKLLVPMAEDQNIHKAKQLRELALINGTLRDIPKCRICGEDGHKIQDCPKRQAAWQPANVRCSICGQDTHVALDCPNKGLNTATQLNDEYASFMAELGGGGGGEKKSAPPPEVEAPTTKPSDAKAPPPASGKAMAPGQGAPAASGSMGRGNYRGPGPGMGPPPQGMYGYPPPMYPPPYGYQMPPGQQAYGYYPQMYGMARGVPPGYGGYAGYPPNGGYPPSGYPPSGASAGSGYPPSGGPGTGGGYPPPGAGSGTK